MEVIYLNLSFRKIILAAIGENPLNQKDSYLLKDLVLLVKVRLLALHGLPFYGVRGIPSAMSA